MKASEAGQQREVLLVDDDDAVRDALSWLFEGNGFRVRAFESGEAVLACPEVVAAAGCLVLDMRLSGISGLVLFERLTAGGRCPPVLFLTGHADVPLAVAALKMARRIFWKNRSMTKCCWRGSATVCNATASAAMRGPAASGSMRRCVS